MHQPTKEELASVLAELLGSTVTYKFLAHGYHWNVRGPDFYQFHAFFSEIYEDMDSAVDPLAESLRKIGYDAPHTMQDFMSLSCIDARDSKVTNYEPTGMSETLYLNLLILDEKYVYAFNLASALNMHGTADFLGGRIDMHQKWIWQLKTTIGADATQVQTIQIMD